MSTTSVWIRLADSATLRALLALVMLCGPLGVGSDPLHSPVRSEHADSAVQNSVLRSDETWHEDWTPEAAEDWVVLGHDRKASAIVGYQRSTGRVFNQKQPSGMGASRAMHLETAFIVRVPMGTREEDGAECSVLQYEADGLHWASTSAVLPNPSQLWAVRGHTGWSETATSRLTLRSNTDTDLECDCMVRRTRGVYRNTLVRRLQDCSAKRTQDVHSLHGMQVYRTLNNRRAAFCRKLGRSLGASTAGFFAVGINWWRHRGATTCAATTRLALGHLHDMATNSVTIDPTATPKQPRSAVLMQLKRSVQMLDAIDGTTASMTFMLEQLLQITLRGLSAEDLDALHVHERQTQTTLDGRKQALDSIPEEQMPLGYQRTCTAPADNLVREFLESTKVAWTPETVNTTRVSYAVCDYLLRHLECHQTQVEATSAAVDCMSLSVAGAERLQTASLHDGLTGVLTAMSSVSDAGSAIQALRSATRHRHMGESLESGSTPEMLADQAVELAQQAAEALLRRMSSVAGGFASFMDVWKAVFTEAPSNLTIAHNWTRSDTFEDIWCCGVLQPLPVVQSPAYPSCLPHSTRQIRREIKRVQ